MSTLLDDHLKGLQPAEVAAWYGRLADFIEKNDTNIKDALAPKFLRHYLNGGGKELIFSAPNHLKQSKYVVKVLNDHRAWYLTEKPFKGKWAGIISRLQGKHPTDKWVLTSVPMLLQLNSLVEIEVKWFSSHTLGDNDLMTSLHGFQLYTQCVFVMSPIQGKTDNRVNFLSFVAWVNDKYDFDPDEYFPVPNPDYKNKFNVVKPVAQNSEIIAVYHRNAIRMEKAGLARPFALKSHPWTISDLKISGPAQINPAKKLGLVLPGGNSL